MAEERKSDEISVDFDDNGAKKLKSSDDPQTTKDKMAANLADNGPTSAPDVADQGENCLKTLMLNISRDLHSSITSLGDRLKTLEDNIESRLVAQLTSVIHTTVKDEINRVRSDFDSEICAMKTKLMDMEKSFADAVKAEPNASTLTVDSSEVSVVIKNLKVGNNETEGQTGIVKNKVISLVRDGLKLKNVKCVKAERKRSRGDNPGMVVASFETKQQAMEVMKNKSVLRKTSDYRSVYIEPVLSHSELSTQSSLRTLLKEIGKDRHYYVNGSKLISRNAGNNNNASSENPSARRDTRSQSRDRDTRAHHNDNRSRQSNGRQSSSQSNSRRGRR